MLAPPLPPPGTVVRLLRLTGFPILQQLQLEEALLRYVRSLITILTCGPNAP